MLKFIENEILRFSNEIKVDTNELSSTLLFVAIKGKRFIAGHIGDGVIGVINKDGSTKVLSHPQNGEAANQTYFTTTFFKKERLRLYKGNIKNIDGFILFSDGVEDSLYHKQTKTLATSVFSMCSWLKTYNSFDVSMALYKNLNDIIRKKTIDDCSIALIVREEEDE